MFLDAVRAMRQRRVQTTNGDRVWDVETVDNAAKSRASLNAAASREGIETRPELMYATYTVFLLLPFLLYNDIIPAFLLKLVLLAGIFSIGYQCVRYRRWNDEHEQVCQLQVVKLAQFRTESVFKAFCVNFQGPNFISLSLTSVILSGKQLTDGRLSCGLCCRFPSSS